MAQDLRHAVRALRRSPVFAATVIVTLALGIGANVAMFGVVDRLMFRPHAYLRDPSHVHRVYLRWVHRGTERTQRHTEYARYLDLRRWTTSFSQVAAFAHRPMAVGVGDAARERQVAVVSAAFFDFFEARPALGRFFVAAEDTTPRGADVVVLGHGYWKSEFGGRDVRGETLQVGSIRATIIGVAPEGFAGVHDGDPPAAYLPITTYAGAEGDRRNAATYFTAYNWGWVEMMVRRKPGVSLAAASADASRAHLRSWNLQHASEPSLAAAEVARPSAVVSALRPGAGPVPGLEARTAVWVAGVAAVLLVVACANVANLFLARALERRRETAVRLALGAGDGRLARGAVAEGLVLSIAGGAVGLLVAQWGGVAVRRLLVEEAGASLPVLTDWRTLGVALGLALGCGLLTGLAPVLLAARGDLAPTLRSDARAGRSPRTRARRALLVAQGALSVALLVGAALFVKSLANVRAMRMGYEAERVLLVSRNLRGMELDDSARVGLRRSLLAAAQAIPAVEHASWVSSVPFWSTSTTNLFVAGIDSVRALGEFTYQTATTDYFRVMRTRILRGRGFTADDRAGAPRIAVVSESMARRLWPGREAIGQCMRVFADTMPCSRVVGVAEDMVQGELTGTRLHYYLPIEQHRPAGGHSLLLRMRGDPALQAESVRKALQAAMPGPSYVTVRPLRDAVDDTRRSWRLGATMFAGFGALALLVAAVGLYGVIGYDIERRRHELGVRVALGARSRDILRLVVGEGVRLGAAGVALGIVLALLASRALEPLLFQQSATDPTIYAGVGATMLAVALVASASPAARAARADPNSALRAE